MADGETRAVRPGELYQSLKLFADHFRFRARVEEHVTPDGTQSRCLCRAQRNASRTREAVDEVEIAAPAHPVHEPPHGARFLGESAAHVVVYSTHVRHGGEPGIEHRLNFQPRHATGHRPGPESLVLLGFHGHVQQHFLVQLESDAGQAARIGGVRQDRVGDGSRKLDGTQAVQATITQVVDDDADGGQLTRPVGALGNAMACDAQGAGEQEPVTRNARTSARKRGCAIHDAAPGSRRWRSRQHRQELRLCRMSRPLSKFRAS